MHWIARAALLHLMDRLPGGHRVYQRLQRAAGDFRRPEHRANRLQKQAELARRFVAHGGQLGDARIVEVGTGWVPLIPIGFWLCGARSVSTFDAYQNLSPPLLQQALRWMGEERQAIAPFWQGLEAEDAVEQRLERLAELQKRPLELLEVAAIECHAPADAAHLDLADGTVDLHYSANTLEHIPPETIVGILREARRVLAPGGLVVHHVDPSDHFSHSSPSLSRIHFLRYENRQWDAVAGNRYAYLNRLHDSDYRKLFDRSGLRLVEAITPVDPEVWNQLQEGYPLAVPFQAKSREELAHRCLTYVARGD